MVIVSTVCSSIFWAHTRITVLCLLGGRCSQWNENRSDGCLLSEFVTYFFASARMRANIKKKSPSVCWTYRGSEEWPCFVWSHWNISTACYHSTTAYADWPIPLALSCHCKLPVCIALPCHWKNVCPLWWCLCSLQTCQGLSGAYSGHWTETLITLKFLTIIFSEAQDSCIGGLHLSLQGNYSHPGDSLFGGPYLIKNLG